jgi:hypothetical protein
MDERRTGLDWRNFFKRVIAGGAIVSAASFLYLEDNLEDVEYSVGQGRR